MIEGWTDDEILVLDGAMGTMLPPTDACCDLLSVSSPELVYDVHRSYLEAGADIITTNTFNVNGMHKGARLTGDDYGDMIRVLSRESAAVARRAVDDYCNANSVPEGNRPLVAGCIGPGRVPLSSLGLNESDKMAAGFRSACELQAVTLIEAGVDLLLLETFYDMKNLLLACAAVRGAFDCTGRHLPLMISVVMNDEGRLASGETLPHLVKAVEEYSPISIGLNCCGADKQLIKHINHLAALTERCLSIHPNAGMPDANGVYPMTPGSWTDAVLKCLQTGRVNIVGGCCGTTPEHIRQLSKVVKTLRRSGV